MAENPWQKLFLSPLYGIKAYYTPFLRRMKSRNAPCGMFHGDSCFGELFGRLMEKLEAR
jgi:hypothetical protein